MEGAPVSLPRRGRSLPGEHTHIRPHTPRDMVYCEVVTRVRLLATTPTPGEREGPPTTTTTTTQLLHITHLMETLGKEQLNKTHTQQKKHVRVNFNRVEKEKRISNTPELQMIRFGEHSAHDYIYYSRSLYSCPFTKLPSTLFGLHWNSRLLVCLISPWYKSKRAVTPINSSAKSAG